ncbi:MAG: aminomethyl-transferring glycine dehydrogenase subunit GcvPB [Thermaerobacter sp.]|nr:aminomethyl-transferring glycine dehydrogenase subunit GcvPB [Thermaerobacter sp.]
MKTIFEEHEPGRRTSYLPERRVDLEKYLPASSLRQDLPLPELAEIQVVRHFTELSHRNHGVDSGFYPLGSCTMKYNPKINEDTARFAGFAALHPYQAEETVQGALQLMWELQGDLQEITGMDAVSLQPAAGAHGELTGILMIRAYHRARGDMGRTQVIVPDSAHGTNPATAAMAGFEVVHVPSDDRGGVDLDALRQVVSEKTAALMLTNPNTLGLFDERISEIAATVHGAGGLLYYDGANLNAVLGRSRPGDMGFDVVHLNLHKTFSTPHGGGGPGSGPVGVKVALRDFLPMPVIARRDDGSYGLDYDIAQSIGQMRSFYGNFGMLVRAYTYIHSLGGDGLRGVADDAVLNANYLLARLKAAFQFPFERIPKHEFVIAPPKDLKRSTGVRTLDIAKRLLDFGVHPPTVYFPLIVDEAMMLEPTETETRETLDAFSDILLGILKEAYAEPDVVKTAPHHASVGRLDEAKAVREPKLRQTIGG